MLVVAAIVAHSLPATDALAQDTARYTIVPAPARLSPRTGEFRIGSRTRIALSPTRDEELHRIALLIAEPLRAASGYPLPLIDAATAVDAADIILFRIDAPSSAATTSSPYDWSDGVAESYRLDVSADRVVLDATTHAGLFRGTQTLRQLLPPAFESAWRLAAEWNDAGDDAAGRRARNTAALAPAAPATWDIPAVEIDDEPRFRYRGMHLDVGRHFFPVAFIRKYIDLIAMYRSNVFHWHLTEDQGWRIEIRRYPRLTSVGAFRRETILGRNFDPYIGDGVPYGGFYTQAEIAEIVAFAASRYVTIIPEIEMPGHSVAALAAYPELACTPGPFEVHTRWGVTDDILCPSERTFAFLEGVLDEVVGLFPGRYVHIGGDEAPKGVWRESPLAQEVIRSQGLADEGELQSWFIRRVDAMLRSRDRRLIGWDEILDGGLAPDATVMSWLGMSGAIVAARQGHDVIMTPTSHTYFDYYQGDPAVEPLANGSPLPLERVYAFEPVPLELNGPESRHVLGAQGNVWTEYMSSADHVEYMVLPRMLAMAEVAWSPAGARRWSDFLRRLPAQLQRLDALATRYRVPDVTGLEADRLTLNDTIRISLGAPIRDAVVRYTLDGSDPTTASTAFSGDFDLPATAAGVTVSARAFLPGGRSSAVRRARFTRTTLIEPVTLPADSKPDLRVDYFEGRVSTADELRGMSPIRSATTSVLQLRGDERDEQFGLRFSGWMRVPEEGIWTFNLTSDDGSRLRIADTLVVDHDGPHGPTALSGQIALRAGWHAFELLFFQAGGGKALALSATSPAGTLRPIAPEWLRHR